MSRIVHPLRLLARRMGFDLVPLALFVLPVIVPIVWLSLAAALE